MSDTHSGGVNSRPGWAANIDKSQKERPDIHGETTPIQTEGVLFDTREREVGLRA